MRVLIPVLAMLLSGCAVNGEWTKADTARQSVYAAAVTADAVTTSRIQHRSDVVESGPMASELIGRNPDDADVAAYFVTVGLSHWMIARALPPQWRKYWQAGTTALHLRAVHTNCEHGLC